MTSSVQMLHETRFGYSDSDPFLLGMHQLQPNVRAVKASNGTQTKNGTFFK